MGQLHGGSASCYNTKGYDIYGALHASWSAGDDKDSRLDHWLGRPGLNDTDVTGAYLSDLRSK